jgi:2-polyprenyl-6-methoxyphenol hydroxylase-like FAD-dependent oxidoreductase
MSLRVLIAGAGLGGLTLAHRLRRAGLQPLVFERGPAHLDLSSSYRIHIDANGSRALHACLPPDLWREFDARSAASPRGIEFVTERLRHLAFIAEADPNPSAVTRSHPISRSGLRQLLLSGLEDVITFERRVVGFERTSNERVAALFADGGSVEGDVLVGADGAASAIRKQLLPHARVVDSGVGGIAGKVYLDDALRQHIGPRWLSQMTMVLPVRGMALFMAPFQRPRSSGAAHLDLPEHLFWVLIGQAGQFESHLGEGHQAAQALQRLALGRVEPWHPLLANLVRATALDSIIGVPLYTAQPTAAWQPGRVTLLGDAIHTMTPLQGLGGNTALVDAALLAQQLIDVDRGHLDLREAIGSYEASMRQYGFNAVQLSLQISNSVASNNVAGRIAFRTVLCLADQLPWLHRQMFQRPSLLPEVNAELESTPIPA